jgi:two-component system response regulator HydG
MSRSGLTAAPPPPGTDESPVHVLVVDDEDMMRRSLARLLLARGWRVDTADGGERALAYLETNDPDVVLCDLHMPGMDGLEVLGRALALRPGLAFVMMSGQADVSVAVEALRAGAYHFLTKPFKSNDAVALTVGKAAEHRRLVDRAHELELRLLAQERFGELIGTSPGMAAVYRVIDGVASTTSTVLILGESGTGKELVARAIHQRSPRAQRPFVPVNCGAIPKDLVETELFGHVRGAFTGANLARAGLFESASGGTIFLDEVGELPLSAQVKLLRVLQEGEIKRVGSDETKVVDVRVVAATNVDLPQLVASGAFRRDLFYRLNVIPITLPPLRERGEDVLVLAAHFLQKLARKMDRPVKRLAPDAVAALRAHTWPGNVRELEHALEHAFVLSRGEEIGPRDLPFTTPAPSVPAPRPASNGAAADYLDLPFVEAKRRAVDAFEEAYLRELMRRCGGNAAEAAREAGLDRSNFRRLLRKRPAEG